MDQQDTRILSEFEGSAAPGKRVTVTLQMDADLLAWLRLEPLGLQQEVNNAVRFVMDMSTMPVPPIEAYEEDEAALETGGPDPNRNAVKIAHDFVP